MAHKGERGYIVVETIGCFLLFVLLNISILSLINLVVVQARVHYALTQAAETVSMYAYTLDALNVSKPLMGIAGKGEAVEQESQELVSNINNVISAIGALDVDGAVDAFEVTYDQVEGIVDYAFDDPKGALQYVLNYGLNEGKNFLFGELMRPLVGHYLSNGDMDGDKFLSRFHVIDGLSGLKFYALDSLSADIDNAKLVLNTEAESRLLTSKGDIKIVVQYDVSYTFGALPLPFSPSLHVTQAVMTKAWLGGHGGGYTPRSSAS